MDVSDIIQIKLQSLCHLGKWYIWRVLAITSSLNLCQLS